MPSYRPYHEPLINMTVTTVIAGQVTVMPMTIRTTVNELKINLNYRTAGAFIFQPIPYVQGRKVAHVRQNSWLSVTALLFWRFYACRNPTWCSF